jgi:hypothetical protein
MIYQYDLNHYLEWCKEEGCEPFLPTYFDIISNSVTYNASTIAKICGVSTETPRRWFREGKIINQSASNTYKTDGQTLKQFLFNSPTLINQLNAKYPRFFKVSKSSI